jgi:hypothetical protein
MAVPGSAGLLPARWAGRARQGFGGTTAEGEVPSGQPEL